MTPVMVGKWNGLLPGFTRLRTQIISHSYMTIYANRQIDPRKKTTTNKKTQITIDSLIEITPNIPVISCFMMKLIISPVMASPTASPWFRREDAADWPPACGREGELPLRDFQGNQMDSTIAVTLS